MRKKGNILVVDDNVNILASLKLLLDSVFESVHTLSSPKHMLSVIGTENIDAVLLDMNFVGGMNTGNEGLFWLKEIARCYPKVPVVLFTAYADVSLAVNAMKEGAFDFVVKPWDNRKLIDTLKMAYRRRLQISGMSDVADNDMYWGDSEPMKRLRDMVEKVAGTDVDVLITGENGTGKDLLARELHSRSLRAGKKFVSVDMGAITETLFESELFGHVKGSFTDARTDRKGYIEEADGGTLFLDEIGNLPMRYQAKLLNVLQRRCVTRVGSNKSEPVDIRLICATNKDIDRMAIEGSFREDLLYRINTIHLRLPSLRDRQGDIVPLAYRFLSHFAQLYKRNIESISRSAETELNEHVWSGNIRELRHTIEKAVIICNGNEIKPCDLQITHVRNAVEKPADTLEEMERKMITDALNRYGNNMSLVATKLGISRQTLYNKMKRYEIG